MSRATPPSAGDGQPLLTFSTDTHAITTQALGDLCLNMEVATVSPGTIAPVCTDFTLNLLLWIDATGKSHIVTPNGLPATPQPYTSAIVPGGGSNGADAYYVELEELFGTNRWYGFDLATGHAISNSTVYQNWKLAMAQYVPAFAL
jgi:hypothetical protein